MTDLTSWCTFRTTNEPQNGVWFGTVLVGTTVSEADIIDVGSLVENINQVLFAELRAGTAGNCAVMSAYSNGTGTVTIGGTGMFNTFQGTGGDTGTASEMFVIGLS